jgi:hypothetical protein
MLTAATFACQQFLTLTAAEFKREFKTKILRESSLKRQICLRSHCHFCDAKKNAEAVHHFQPRVARASALPWATSKTYRNAEGVAENLRPLVEFANSFRVHSGPSLCSPGRCPGLKFANAFGVSIVTNRCSSSLLCRSKPSMSAIFISVTGLGEQHDRSYNLAF